MSKERMKKYREKLNHPGNEELKRDYMNRNQAAQQKYKEKMLNSECASEFKKKKSQQASESRKRRALRELNSQQLPGSGFKTKKGLTKAVKRLKQSMPKEREKQIEAIEAVAKDLDLNFKNIESEKVPVSRQRRYFQDIPEMVKDFYLLDSVSRQLPGQKDVITIKSVGGVKEKFQKRVMLSSIEDAFSEFCSLYPDHKVGKSMFFNLRPRFVLLMSQTPQNVCCCIYCSNFQFIYDALKPYFCEEIENCNAFLTKMMCGNKEFECAANICENCQNFDEKLRELLIESCEHQPVKYTKWLKSGTFIQKHDLSNKNVADVLIDFSESFLKYKLHKYLVHTQHNAINEMKRTNAETSVILQMDYSENFAVISQDEVQSAFFTRKQISIFTAVALVGQTDQLSFAIINDDTKHQKEQVFFYMKLIIDELRSIYPNLTHINFITDGCAAQFKNKYILSNLVFMEADYGLKAKWHFMPTSHGKSAADGIGGILKRQVTHRILTGMKSIMQWIL